MSSSHILSMKGLCYANANAWMETEPILLCAGVSITPPRGAGGCGLARSPHSGACQDPDDHTHRPVRLMFVAR